MFLPLLNSRRTPCDDLALRGREPLPDIYGVKKREHGGRGGFLQGDFSIFDKCFQNSKTGDVLWCHFWKIKKKSLCDLRSPSLPPSLPLLYYFAHTTPRSFHFFFLFLCDDFSQSGAITRIRRLMRSRHISQSVGGKSNIHAENFQKKAFSSITALISADFKIAQYLVKTSCNGNETCSINKKDCPS